MMVPMNERKNIRHEGEFSCEVVRERDFKQVATCGLDVSAGGMRVRTNEKILTGERVILTFRTPGGGYFFDAEGVVARVLHGRRPSDDVRSLGIEFRRMNRTDRVMLEHGLRRLPPPAPKRRIRYDYAETIRSIGL